MNLFHSFDFLTIFMKDPPLINKLFYQANFYKFKITIIITFYGVLLNFAIDISIFNYF